MRFRRAAQLDFEGAASIFVEVLCPLDFQLPDEHLPTTICMNCSVDEVRERTSDCG